jgi:hypothetical protein
VSAHKANSGGIHSGIFHKAIFGSSKTSGSKIGPAQVVVFLPVNKLIFLQK